jgi:3-oxoacyl-[acyl-carrier-protein] synthase II
MYLISASAISHQPTFRNPGFSNSLLPLTGISQAQHPDYAAFIPAMDRRRMSDVLKMAVTCSFDALHQAGIKDPGAIIVGTSMGCCTHTRQFMDKILDSNGGPLAPTAFISSTHNTIAGQISLLLGNHGHNMTHTQNSLSFEQALIDAMLCIHEDIDQILVGCADEIEDDLFNMNKRLQSEEDLVGTGASFFVLSSTAMANSIKLMGTQSLSRVENIEPFLRAFLMQAGLQHKEPDLVLFSSFNQSRIHSIKKIFSDANVVKFTDFSGAYFTSPGFATAYAYDFLQQPVNANKTVLICNNLVPENLGLILLTNTTAG